MLSLFAHPFMLRALVGGILLAAPLAGLGVFVSLRRMAFFSDGIAHASLAGIAVAVLAGVAPLPIALAYAIAIALIMWRLERTTKLPSDTVVGIFFTASMALGVMLMSFTRGYQPELVSYLFGSILSVSLADVLLIACASAAILYWLSRSVRSLTFLSLTEETAVVSGVNADLHTAALYVALAASTVLAVKMLGIVLVSALLVLPPASARMVAGSFKEYLLASIVYGELMMVAGLLLSFARDLPSGATVILVGTALFIGSALLTHRPRRV